MFEVTSGLKLPVPIGLKNTFKDAVIIFCNRVGVNPSLIGKQLIFLHNGTQLNVESKENLEQMGFEIYQRVTVVDKFSVTGA